MQKLTRNKYFFIATLVISSLFVILPFVIKIDYERFQALGLLGVLLTAFFGSVTVFVPSPAIFSIGVAGGYYNPLLVGLFAAIGSTIGDATGYLIGYSADKATEFEKRKILYGLLHFTLEKYGVIIILLFSIIPNPFFDGLGILAGFAKYPIKKFLVYVFIGRVLRFYIVALIGNML